VPSLVIAALVFACLTAAVLLGKTASRRLADRHLGEDTRDTIKLSLGLVATLAALLLGLLVSSARDSFEAQRKQVNELAAKVTTLDRVLMLYGKETAAAREAMRVSVEGAVARAWPRDRGRHSELMPDERTGSAIYSAIQQLQPSDASQTDLKQKATDLALELVEHRYLLVAQASGGLSTPLLVVVISWLVLILFGFSLLAPRNGVATLALIVSAVSVCGAVFLLIELYGPFDGLIQIPSEPIHAAIGETAN
jgi:hypothetical protein